MSDVVDAVYPAALEAGIAVEQFWNLSIAEVQDLINAYAQRRKADLKKSIRMQFLLASLIPQYILRDEKDPVPQPWDYYPELFKEEKEIYEKAAAEKEFEDFKERRRQYAAALNKQRRGGSPG